LKRREKVGPRGKGARPRLQRVGKKSGSGVKNAGQKKKKEEVLWGGGNRKSCFRIFEEARQKKEKETLSAVS